MTDFNGDRKQKLNFELKIGGFKKSKNCFVPIKVIYKFLGSMDATQFLWLYHDFQQKIRCAYTYGKKDIEMFLAGRLAYLVFRLFLSRTRHCCDISLNLSVTLKLHHCTLLQFNTFLSSNYYCKCFWWNLLVYSQTVSEVISLISFSFSCRRGQNL